MELKNLKSEEKDVKEYVSIIDGIRFKTPKLFEEYLAVGFIGLFLLITLPIWIIPYLFGRLFRVIANEKEIKHKSKKLFCPVCNLPAIKGDYNQIKCSKCGYYQYLDKDEKWL